MKASKSRTLKKVFLNIVAVLCVLMITGNIIASANAVQIIRSWAPPPPRSS